MAKGIPLSYIVDTTSAGGRDIFSLSKLPALFLQKNNTANPRLKFDEFSNANQVLEAYGADSNAYKFALNYFGFTSKMATKADRITIYNWNETATGATLKGAKLTKAVSELSQFDGALSFDIGGVVENIALNFSTATSYADIATLIQTALNAIENPAYQNSQVFFNQNSGGFVLVCGEVGEASSIGFVNGTGANDLGLTEQSGAMILSGSEAVPTLSEALNIIEVENGAYYNVCFNKDLALTDDDIKNIGKWVNSTNCRYKASVILDNPKWKNQRDILGDLKGYNGLFLEFRNNEAEQDGLYAGIGASKDYSTQNGNFSTSYNLANAYSEKAVKIEKEMEVLETNKLNAIATFGSVGQFETMTFGDFICGEITNSDTIYQANSFLVLSEQMAIMNLFINEPLVGLRGANNQGKFYSVIDNEFQKAIFNGTAIKLQGEDELTTTEKNKMYSVFGEKGGIAIKSLWKNGYYFVIDGVDLVNKKVHISQAYVGNSPVKKVVIANYILGA